MIRVGPTGPVGAMGPVGARKAASPANVVEWPIATAGIGRDLVQVIHLSVKRTTVHTPSTFSTMTVAPE